MKITIIVEGKTEIAFIRHLRTYLEHRLSERMPNLDPLPYDGRLPTESKLKRVVKNLLTDSKNPADHVIALTDVYTGSQPPVFKDANEAKEKMRQWVGNESRFHPHAAQYDFEAWLLPYWTHIQKLAGSNKAAPSGNPESVNHANPPAHRIHEVFRTGDKGKAYVKPVIAGRILHDNDLSIAILQCSELKSLINTILKICNAAQIP